MQQVVHLSDRLWKWYNAPVVLGLVYLELRRTLHQKYNLIAVGTSKQDLQYQVPAPLRDETIKLFTDSGGAKDDEQSALLHNDQPDHGFFGRNAEPRHQKSQVRSSSSSHARYIKLGAVLVSELGEVSTMQ